MIKCDCGLIISYTLPEQGGVSAMCNVVGQQNGQPVFQFTFLGQLTSIWFNGSNQWFMTGGDILIGEWFDTWAIMYQDADLGIGCPVTNEIQSWQITGGPKGWRVDETIGIACEVDCRNEDRIFKEYKSIKLPENFEEQARGWKDCCCEQLVLGDKKSKETWTNDLTSFWIKLSDQNDSAAFYIKNNETGFTQQLNAIEFVNEPNAFYATVNWGIILSDIGVGCYELYIEYNISGIIGTISWGSYQLKPYSIENAMKTARVSAKFDGYHEIEGINFSGSNVASTFRFYGFIGFRQPNYEIDNLIYGDRQMKRNLRENLNSYEIITDPADECIIRPLVELYLLSENELYISDYNVHNHSYRYLDLPVIVQESPKIEYPDEFARKASLTCTVGDKFKNKRTYY
jgi:hypothetical protein